MGKIITNRHTVDAPPTGPLRYGLFTAATRLDLDVRGIGSGYQWTSDHCGQDGVIYDQTCAASPTKPVVEGTDTFGSDPFWVISRKRCGTVGRTAAEAQAAAMGMLATSEQGVVEDVLWDGGGLVGHEPVLTTAGATVVTPAAGGFGAAIAALEEAFYSAHGYLGTIHVNTAAYAAAAYSQLLTGVGGAGALRTPIGSTWSFGAGYGITGPAGVAPAAGNVWAFMTAPVTIWSQTIESVDPRATLDRTANQWDTVAERVFIAAYDCQDTVFAVEVPVAAPAVVTLP